ncbi:hypothetical protein cypCar_00042311, partial [Cyprinus carpio]
LDEPWRATDNPYYNNYYYYGMCDYNVEWNGWYRMFYNGQNTQMPESCVNYGMCGTYNPLSLNGIHPQLEDGVVTRQVCLPWSGCCTYASHPIRVKACPGNYYVYEFVKPMFCGAYCEDVRGLNGTSTTEPCAELSCTEDEWCGEENGVYGCLCNENQTRPDSFDFSETCESSSGSMSVSRCQLFEAGFSADVLHLNDPNCKGTVRNGRVEFHFDNNEHICGTNLLANGTHFIYSNFILGTPRCPNPNDDTVELLQNGVSTSSRFSFRMFIFTANSTKLYLHCTVHLCLLSSNRCSTISGSHGK